VGCESGGGEGLLVGFVWGGGVGCRGVSTGGVSGGFVFWGPLGGGGGGARTPPPAPLHPKLGIRRANSGEGF